MNAEIIGILSKYGQSTIDNIRENLSSTGTNATGKTAKSLKYEVLNKGNTAILQISGRGYFMAVETGRKPTPQYDKPSFEFVASIREWAKAKGLPEGSAYAIAKSIHKKGTRLHADGGRQDIVSNVINDNLTDKIASDLLSKFADLYLSNIVKTYKDGSNGNIKTTGS